MNLTTKEEILAFWRQHESVEAKMERKEAEALKKDIQTAQTAIKDAIARYRKVKLRARSKAKANGESPFRELEDYSSIEDIRNAYGYEMISEEEMERLMALWELREQADRKSGPYADRVTEMLELASQAIWKAYGEKVIQYDEKICAMSKEAGRIAEENFQRDLRREQV